MTNESQAVQTREILVRHRREAAWCWRCAHETGRGTREPRAGARGCQIYECRHGRHQVEEWM